MDRLWSPWRYNYIAGMGGEKANDESCIFCDLSAADPSHDERNFILHRAEHNYIVLNLYPYASGHLLIVPYEHTADLDEASEATTAELMRLTVRCQTALRAAYAPDGFNLGMNLGRAAGAGVAAHIHLHILPRWTGDANFMTTIGETRVLPEELTTTYKKLREIF
ncbi:MAG: HIT domain-containing protein [Pyrinomonadaceae bacterium]|nr:HIT domain-containing protein [Pyrinomonadaceae bacterium]